MLQQARAQLERKERLMKQGALGEGEMEQARTEVAVFEARLRGKEAQVHEAQIRLQQASRQLSRLRPSQAPVASPGQPAAGQPFRYGIATVAPEVSTPEGAEKPTTPVPAASNPFRPRAAPEPNFRWHADGDQKLRDLEKKVEILLREVEVLRRELRKQSPASGAVDAPAATPSARTPAPAATPPPTTREPSSVPPADPAAVPTPSSRPGRVSPPPATSAPDPGR